MDDNIVLERSTQPNVMKLDNDEEALMNEIQLEPHVVPRRPRPSKAARPQQRPSGHGVQDEAIDAFTNPTKMSAPPRPPPEVVDYGEEDDHYGFDDGQMYEQDEGQGYDQAMPTQGYNTIDEEKIDLLNKLTRLEKKGLTVNKRLNMYSGVDEIRTEVNRLSYGIEVDQSVRFSRRMMIACVTGLEFLNKRYNPLDLALEGWSESVMENVDDYDGVFEELYVKYKSSMQVAPEVKLIMMLGGSATMFHLTNSMFKALPNANDVLKQNPGLMKNMMDAVKNTASAQSGATPATTTTDSTGRREMQGPGIDLASLMGGISMPPPMPVSSTNIVQEAVPMPTNEQVFEDEDDDMSDIVSVAGESTGGEVKEVSIKKGRKKGRSKKNEVSI